MGEGPCLSRLGTGHEWGFSYSPTFPSPSFIHSSHTGHGFNHSTIDSQLLGPCQTPRPRRVGDLGSLGVGFWGVHFWYWNAYQGPSSAPCNLKEVKCPLYTLSPYSLVKIAASYYRREAHLSTTPPNTHTGKLRGSPPEAVWCAPRLPAAVLSSTACELGFYKSAPGDQLCARCPPHSHSATPAAQTCRCDLSYYRATLDPPSAACTREYCLAALLVGPPCSGAVCL